MKTSICVTVIGVLLTLVVWTIAGRSDTTTHSSAPEGITASFFVVKLFVSFVQEVTWPSLTTCIVTSVVGVLSFYLYRLLFVPLNRVRLLGDVGYISEGRLSKKDIVNVVRKSRRVGDIPPVYPNGWFYLLESRDLQVKDAKMVSCLGKNYAVFRAEDGIAHVIDAYCPHLGANLAAGGRVFGNCIECPFHGWRFRGEDGKCTAIPYAEKIPDVARVEAYISVEVNGFIYVWHHAERLEPTWFPPVIEEIKTGQWVYRGRTEHHLNCHIQEVPENGADIAHLAQVHTPFLFDSPHLKDMWTGFWSFIRHQWEGTWAVLDPATPHIGTLTLHHYVKIFGYPVNFMNSDVVAEQIGPGIVYMKFSSSMGNGAYLHNITPQAPMDQKIVHHIVFTSWMPTFIAKFMMLGEALQIERDFMIWVNKRYQSKPVFVKCPEDGILSKHRRWYSQFYTENSPKLTFSEDSLEW